MMEDKIEKEVTIKCYVCSKKNICAAPTLCEVKFIKWYNGAVSFQIDDSDNEINIGKEDLTKILEFLNTD